MKKMLHRLAAVGLCLGWLSWFSAAAATKIQATDSIGAFTAASLELDEAGGRRVWLAAESGQAGRDRSPVTGLAKNASYPNPLIEQRADPWIWKHTDGTPNFGEPIPDAAKNRPSNQ